MMLYSKNGSIPKPETDGTDGWIEVEDPPTAGAGEEVVWWYPPGWVVQPVKPVQDGFVYDWSQSEGRWIESPTDVVVIAPDPAPMEIGSASVATTLDFGSATGG